MPSVLLACALAFAPVQDAPRAQLSVEAATYLAEALATMREASYHREQVDWPVLRRNAFAAAAGAETPVDTYDALRGALAALGDHHSFLQLSPELARLEDARRAPHPRPAPETGATGRGPPSSAFLARRAPEAHAHDTDAGPIARVVVPMFDGADANAFARALQELVHELDARRPLGWIVDLRGNGGGNMWPMLAGIGPVLGEGRVGAFRTLRGVGEHWYYRDGRAGVENDGGESQFVAATVAPPRELATPSPPVVVLIDDGTASSGEAVAIAFRGRPRTRLIGTPTYGLSSSNQGFVLGDGANLVITTGLDVDRTGKEYADQVVPDEVVSGPACASDEDLQLARALDWLVEQN